MDFTNWLNKGLASKSTWQKDPFWNFLPSHTVGLIFKKLHLPQQERYRPISSIIVLTKNHKHDKASQVWLSSKYDMKDMRVILIISSANKVHSLFYSLINIVCWRTVQLSKSLLILVFWWPNYSERHAQNDSSLHAIPCFWNMGTSTN